MKNPPRQTLVLANATRLLNDARLLVAHRCFASAFALAELGVEEIGKAVIDSWESEAPLAKPKGAPSLHIRKQTAAVALLLGTYTLRTFPGGLTAEQWEGDTFKSILRMFNESAEGQLFLAVQNYELDKRKQNALYQDDWLTAVEDDFAEEHVNGLFQIASAARDAISDGDIRRAARAWYEMTLTKFP